MLNDLKKLSKSFNYFKVRYLIYLVKLVTFIYR